MSTQITVPSGRYAPNPRTEDLPMAFTRWEFLRGVIATYLAFIASTAAVSVWWYVVGAIVAVTYAAPIAFVTTIFVGAPLSYAIGWSLRAVRSTAIHLAAHAGSGIVAGFAGLSIFLMVTDNIWTWSMPHPPDYTEVAKLWWILVYPLLTPFCAMWGWRFTSRRALAA